MAWEAASRHPARRARPVPLAQPGGRVGDGGEVRVGRASGARSSRASWSTSGAGERRRAPAFVSRGGIKLANALTATGLDVRGQARAGRGRLDRRLHRLPAAAGRRRGDRGRRRLRAARLEPAQRSARARARAHERARADARAMLAVRARTWRRSTCRSSRSRRCCGAVLGCLARGLRRARAGQAAVRGRPRAVGKGGRGARRRRTAAPRSWRSGEAALALGARVLGYHSSGLPGPKGNRETFIWLADAARAQASAADASSDLDAMAP